MAAKILRFSDDKPKMYEIPRLTWEEIDELFYQEDEIGEMRHTAFMIECGLEEDPPDGPDVPPIPWKKEDVKITPSVSKPVIKQPRVRPTPTRKVAPTRIKSMDNGLDDLHEGLSTKPRMREPVRKIAASKSGSLHGMRKGPPSRSMSVDTRGKNALPLSVSLARTEKKTKKITQSNSGSLHHMRGSSGDEPMTIPKRPSKLVAARSGNLHGMRDSIKERLEKNEAELDGREKKRSVSRTKSGSSEGSSDSFLNDIDLASYGSDASIPSDLETDSEDEFKAKNKKPSSKKSITKDDEKKKKKKKSSDKKSPKVSDKKSPKVKTKKVSKDKEKKEKDPSKPSSGRRFKVKKVNPDDLPPAFRTMAMASK